MILEWLLALPFLAARRRFVTEEEIIHAVDRCIALAKRHEDAFTQHDRAARSAQVEGDLAKLYHNQTQADRHWGLALRARSRAAYYGRKLAEFRTRLLPTITDRSIPR